MQELNQENFDEEIWVGLQPYPEHFQVSNLGRIKRLASNTLKWNRSKLGKSFLHNTRVEEKILKPTINRYGYAKIRTQVNGVRYSFSVHQAVAITFLPNVDGKPCVNHKDGNKQNNRLHNLEWCTYLENSIHYHEGLGKGKTTTGAKAARFKSRVFAYKLGSNKIYETLSGNLDMKEKGFDFRLVSAVLKGKRNSHNGCYFKREVVE